jgi:hypothetical protein
MLYANAICSVCYSTWRIANLQLFQVELVFFLPTAGQQIRVEAYHNTKHLDTFTPQIHDRYYTMSHLKRVQSAQTPRPSPPAARGGRVNNNNSNNNNIRFNHQHHNTTDTHSSTLETLETDEDFDSSRPYDRENSRARSSTVAATPQQDNESTSANTARLRDRSMTVQPMPVHHPRNNYVDPDAATTTCADNSTSTGNGIDAGYGNEDRMDLADKARLPLVML